MHISNLMTINEETLRLSVHKQSSLSQSLRVLADTSLTDDVSFTWKAMHFDRSEIELKVIFENALQVSSTDVRDELKLEVLDTALFISKATFLHVISDKILSGRIPP